MKTRNIFFVVITLIFVFLLALGFKEMRMALGSFELGIWYFFLLAFFFQVLFFVFQSEVRRALYRVLGIREKFWDMFRMTIAGMFVGTAIPSMHLSSLTLFMQEAKAKNYSQSKALVGSLTFILFDFLGFLSVLILALVFLLRFGGINRYQLFSSALFVILITLAALAIFFVLEKEDRIRWILEKISKLIPKKKRAKWLPKTEIDLLAKEAIEARKFYAEKKMKLWKPLLFAFLTQVAGALSLGACFLAFGVNFSFSTIVIVYAMAMLFEAVAFTPYGIGTAEVGLTVTLTGMGIPLNTSLLLMMSFRFFDFWLPMMGGYASTKTLSFMRGKKITSLE